MTAMILAKKLAITRHLSSHMEEISLATLPARVETDDECDSYASSTPVISDYGAHISSDKHWGAHESTIIQLYKTENMTLEETMEFMRKYYNFVAG